MFPSALINNGTKFYCFVVREVLTIQTMSDSDRIMQRMVLLSFGLRRPTDNGVSPWAIPNEAGTRKVQDYLFVCFVK